MFQWTVPYQFAISAHDKWVYLERWTTIRRKEQVSWGDGLAGLVDCQHWWAECGLGLEGLCWPRCCRRALSSRRGCEEPRGKEGLEEHLVVMFSTRYCLSDEETRGSWRRSNNIKTTCTTDDVQRSAGTQSKRVSRNVRPGRVLNT